MKEFGQSIRISATLLVVVLLGGCAFGQKIAYRNVVADMEASGNTTVAVAVHDERPYILSGDKKPDFVGLSRGGYGNPFDVGTASGAPLADDMGDSIADSLGARGFHATAVRVSASQSLRAAKRDLRASGAQRLVFVELKEWKSDKFFRTSLYYDVTVHVFDGAGEERGAATFKGDDNIGKQAVAEVFRRKIETWFSDPKIVDALK